jgi:hypothetical protein
MRFVPLLTLLLALIACDSNSDEPLEELLEATIDGQFWRADRVVALRSPSGQTTINGSAADGVALFLTVPPAGGAGQSRPSATLYVSQGEQIVAAYSVETGATDLRYRLDADDARQVAFGAWSGTLVLKWGRGGSDRFGDSVRIRDATFRARIQDDLL